MPGRAMSFDVPGPRPGLDCDVLEWSIAQRGKPEVIRCDNGPEFTSRHFLTWCEEKGVELLHIQPGRPMQNGHVESFNGRFRGECLNHHWFTTLMDAREKIKRWRMEYNAEYVPIHVSSGSSLA